MQNIIPDNWEVLKFLFLGKEQTNNIPETEISSQRNNPSEEKRMNCLTLDVKNNCYVITPTQMENLQQKVARSFTVDKGSFDIRIDSGRYSHAKTGTEGEPFVLLWIYGVDGSTFINKNTGSEVSTAWITLNGCHDNLKLEVKKQAVVCALFFDVNNTDNRGSINLLITSNAPSFQPATYTVDSKQNCYVLEETDLSNLKQQNANSIELHPGRYKVRIRESTASYWLNDKINKIEPWALILIQGGKFIPKFTGIELEQTWCSLNGLNDQFILEVKEKTTLSGFFFDTYKEDKNGQIILAIEPVPATDWIEYQNSTPIINDTVTTKTMTEPNNTNIEAPSGTSNIEEVNISHDESTIINDKVKVTTKTMTETNNTNIEVPPRPSNTEGVNINQEVGFSFHFDEAQMEQMWQQMAAKIETSVKVEDEQDKNKEAFYWDNLEKWLLKGYQTQAKSLAMQVARVEFMTKALSQQMEASFNQNFQAWSGYFDKRLNELINTRISTMVDSVVNEKIANQTQEIKNLVVQQIQTDIDQRIDSVVNVKIANQTQEVKNLVIQQMQTDIDQRINNVVNVKIANQTQEVKNLVIQQMQTDIDQRINNVVNIKVDNQTQEIKNLVVQQIQTDIDQRITYVTNKSTEENVQAVVKKVMTDIDNRINVNLDNKILNFRNDVTCMVRNEITQNFMESITRKIISDITTQQFYLDIQLIKTEVENFYAKLGQFETQLYLRINQGDTQLYNWTLEQLVALQGCLTDRQTLVELFETFAGKLKTELDNAPCVNTRRFTPWIGVEVQPQLSPVQPQQLPQG